MKRVLPVVGIALIVCVGGDGAWADPCTVNKPSIRSIDRTCLPVPGGVRPLPMFKTDVAGPYQEIAYIDSFTAPERCVDTVRAQLKDMQAKGESIGADAVIRLRTLSNKITGWQEDPYTPFFSVRQGPSEDFFFRATAIKYVGRRGMQGTPIYSDVPAASGQPGLLPTLPGAGGGLDSDRFFRTRERRNDPINPRYEQDYIPQVLSTQPTGPR